MPVSTSSSTAEDTGGNGSKGSVIELTAEPDHKVAFCENLAYPLLVNDGEIAAHEHFAIMRSRLVNARAKLGISSVMITSPEREEGKTMICANLAISFGRLGRPRLLVVDGDLRVRGLTGLLRMHDRPGLAEYLQRNISLQEAVHATTYPSVFVAPAGNCSDDLLPAILEGGRWPEFLAEAKQQFDLILIDSVPAVAPIADCELLGSACDTILLIVRLGKTSREALDFAKKSMERKLLGVVINNTDRSLGLSYDSYYRKTKQSIVHNSSPK